MSTQPDPASGEPATRRQRRERSRHSSGQGSRAAGPVILGGALAAALVAGGAWWASGLGGGESRAGQPVGGDVLTAGPSTPGATSGPSGTADNTSAVSDPAAACRSEVSAGEKVASTSATIAVEWRTHTEAQTNVDAGKITKEAAEADWKKSKATGPASLAAYNKAVSAYQSAAGKCGKLTTSADPKVRACAQRAGTLGKVTAASAPIARDWSDHIVAMKGKAHAEHHNQMGEYMAAFRKLCAAAPGLLKTYDTSKVELSHAPACSA